MDVYVEVFGCTANKSDAALIKGLIQNSKHELVNDSNNADIIVIITCTVIDTTEQRMISQMKKYKKTGKNIIVAGCMASIQIETIIKILPDAKLLPPQYSPHILDLIENKETKFIYKNKTKYAKCYNDVIAPISISEGCMFSCTYCITSLARGKLKSFPINEIKKDVSYAVEKGCREIQLTAQDSSSYGLDIKSNLGILLKKTSEIIGDFRIRAGMMNPFTCKMNLDSIVEGFQSSKIYKFLHLPIQSGDNDILKKMKRKYNIDDVLKIIKKFKQKYPDLTISTDIIVGFPSETEDQFQNTIRIIKKIKPDITNITKFSARPFTKAKTMIGRINTDIVKNRSKKLTEICSNISYDNNKKHNGKKYNLLITEKGKNKTFVGRSENYKPVVIDKKVDLGEFVEVEIIDYAPTYLVGSII
jgi:MiaB-like tRNA modifying enzyme